MGCLTVIINVLLVFITGGAWLIVLIVWALLKMIGIL